MMNVADRCQKVCTGVLYLVLLLAAPSCLKKQAASSETCIPSCDDEIFVLVPDLPPADIDQAPNALPTPEIHQIPTQLPQAAMAEQKTTAKTIAHPMAMPTEETQATPPTETIDKDPNSLSFPVENTSAKTLYVTCFSYIKNKDFGRWRWDKSAVYELKAGEIKTVDIDPIPDERDRNHIFGILAVFEQEQNAEQATYQLLDDKRKLDLDLLYKLKDKKVTIFIQKYGLQGSYYEYDFVKEKKSESTGGSLDFRLKNGSGVPIVATCFSYQKKAKGNWVAATEEKDDMTVWRFDKSPVFSLEPDQEVVIPIDRVVTARDRQYMRGYLAIFAKGEEEKAEKATFELLESDNKLILGELWRLKDQKVIVKVERYGYANDFVDFVIKPTQRVDFSSVYRSDGTIKHTRTTKS